MKQQQTRLQGTLPVCCSDATNYRQIAEEGKGKLVRPREASLRLSLFPSGLRPVNGHQVAVMA
jgi:hypothetical protein